MHNVLPDGQVFTAEKEVMKDELRSESEGQDMVSGICFQTTGATVAA